MGRVDIQSFWGLGLVFVSIQIHSRTLQCKGQTFNRIHCIVFPVQDEYKQSPHQVQQKRNLINTMQEDVITLSQCNSYERTLLKLKCCVSFCSAGSTLSSQQESTIVKDFNFLRWVFLIFFQQCTMLCKSDNCSLGYCNISVNFSNCGKSKRAAKKS